MRLTELITAHVGATTLDPARVKEFLQTPPHYHQWGVHQQLNQTALDQLNATDLFEFYLRQYLSGRHKTLNAVLREVRSFRDQDPLNASYYVGYSLDLMHQQLLALEWYELMARLDMARQRIGTLMPLPKYPARPVVINLLSGYD